MTTTDKPVVKKISKAEAMETIAVAIHKLDNMSGGLPEITGVLRTIYDMAQLLYKRNEYMDNLLKEAERLIDATQAANVELTKQRDAIANEAQRLIDDMKAGDFFSDALKTPGEIYEAAMNYHNEAFWQSLPYDMADALGESWMHMDAHALYCLLTDDEEIVAEGYNLTPNEVLEFRKRLLDMVRELTDRDNYPDED